MPDYRRFPGTSAHHVRFAFTITYAEPVRIGEGGEMRKRLFVMAMCCYGAGGFGGAGAVDLAHGRPTLAIVYLAIGFSLSVGAAIIHSRLDDEIERRKP